MLDRFRATFANKAVSAPSRLTPIVAVAATVIVGLAVAGCGSSSDSSGTTTAAPSKTEFLVKANAICTAGNKLTDAAASKTFPSNQAPTQAQATTFGAIATPLIQKQIDAIRALGAPSGDESTVTGMLDTAQQDLDKAKSDPTLLVQGNLFANFAKVAHPYGLTACAANN